MLQWFIRFPEFAEFNESSAPFRKNYNEQMSLFGFCLPFEENGVDCVFGHSMHFHWLCSVVKRERQYFYRCLSVRGLPLKGGGLYERRSAWWDRRDVVNRAVGAHVTGIHSCFSIHSTYFVETDDDDGQQLLTRLLGILLRGKKCQHFRRKGCQLSNRGTFWSGGGGEGRIPGAPSLDSPMHYYNGRGKPYAWF